MLCSKIVNNYSDKPNLYGKIVEKLLTNILERKIKSFTSLTT